MASIPEKCTKKGSAVHCKRLDNQETLGTLGLGVAEPVATGSGTCTGNGWSGSQYSSSLVSVTCG